MWGAPGRSEGGGQVQENFMEEVRFECFWNGGSPRWQEDEDFSRHTTQHVQRLSVWFGGLPGVYPSRGNLLRIKRGVVSVGILLQAETDARQPQLVLSAPESPPVTRVTETPDFCFAIFLVLNWQCLSQIHNKDLTVHHHEQAGPSPRAGRLKYLRHPGAVFEGLINSRFQLEFQGLAIPPMPPHGSWRRYWLSALMQTVDSFSLLFQALGLLGRTTRERIQKGFGTICRLPFHRPTHPFHRKLRLVLFCRH